MEIQRIGAGRLMSDAVIYNGIVFLSGQVGSKDKNTKEQTKEVLAEIDRILQEAGTDKSRLLTAAIWLADMADFNVMNEVWENWVVAGAPPTRATCQLPLSAPEYRVEIVVSAAL